MIVSSARLLASLLFCWLLALSDPFRFIVYLQTPCSSHLSAVDFGPMTIEPTFELTIMSRFPTSHSNCGWTLYGVKFAWIPASSWTGQDAKRTQARARE